MKRKNDINMTPKRLPTLMSALLMASSLISATNSYAATDNVAGTTYIDSVHSWGAWELDIEPAAGGLQQAGTQPLNARSAKVSLRTNSIAALSPRNTIGVTASSTPTAPAPITPAAPPSAPTTVPLSPISPNVPIPGSAPNDGF